MLMSCFRKIAVAPWAIGEMKVHLVWTLSFQWTSSVTHMVINWCAYLKHLVKPRSTWPACKRPIWKDNLYSLPHVLSTEHGSYPPGQEDEAPMTWRTNHPQENIVCPIHCSSDVRILPHQLRQFLNGLWYAREVEWICCPSYGWPYTISCHPSSNMRWIP